MKGKAWKIIALLSAMGAALCLYLLYQHIVGSGPVCPTGGCDDVLASEYSVFLGFSVSGWGLLYYVGFFILALIQEKKGSLLLIKGIGVYLISGVIFTIYLRYLEFFKIGQICLWCWVSVLIIAIITVVYIKTVMNKDAK